MGLVEGIGGADEFAQPGEVLRSLINRLEITQEQLADRIGVSRYSVNQLVNGRRSVTAEMAFRLAKAFTTSPEFWLKLQMVQDLKEAEASIGAEIDRIEPLRRPVPEEDLFYDHAG